MSSRFGLPENFWDPGAYPAVSIRDPVTGATTTGHQQAWGIQSFLAADDPSQPWPDELSPWETIYFSGVRAPGICRVEGGRRKRIDRRDTSGSSGRTVTFEGYEPATFEVILTVWTAAHFWFLRKLYQLLMPRPTALNPTLANASNTAGPNSQLFPNQVPNATNIPATVVPANSPLVGVSVGHPSLEMMGVRDLFVIDFRAPRHIGRQIFECVIDCEEIYPQVNEGAGAIKYSTNENANGTTAFRTLPADPSSTDTGPH